MTENKEQAKIRLRPHHIDIFSYGKVPWGKILLETVYSREFADNIETLKNDIAPDTLVEIISGTDDLCEHCGCPHYEYCKVGDYNALYENMLRRLSPDLPPFILSIVKSHVFNNREKQENPETADAHCLKEKNLKVGKVYVLKDIAKF
jgi:hypothetical protein